VLIEASDAIAKGDLITIDGDGCAVTAASGDFIFGRAFTGAVVAGEVIQAQINQMGYMA